MARPSSPSAAKSTSVRLIQDPSPAAHPVSHSLPLALSDMAQSAVQIEEPAHRKSISVVRTIDLESTSSAGNRSPRRPNVYVQASADAPDVPTVRISKSAGALQKPLPAAKSRLSADETRRHAVPAHKSWGISTTISTSEPNPVSNKPPQFMQSKRWGRTYNPSSAEMSSVDTQVKRPKTARDKSMDLQRADSRAKSKPEAVAADNLAQKPSLSSIRDDHSVTHSGGICGPIPTWHALRATQLRRPNSWPTRHAARVVAIPRKNSLTQSTTDSIRSPSKELSWRKVSKRRLRRTMRAFPDLRRRATLLHKADVVEEPEKVLNLDIIDTKPARERRSPSLVKALQDPIQVKRNSADLFNVQFDNDWQPPGLCLSNSRKSIDFAAGTKQGQGHASVPMGRAQDLEVPQATTSPTASSSQGRSTNKALSAPEPPERTSSKGGARMAQVARASRPIFISILSGTKEVPLPDPTEIKEAISVAEPEVDSKRAVLRQRMPSAFSGRSARAPKHVSSSDTLGMIAGMVETDLKSPRLTAFEKLKQTTGFKKPEHKRKNGSPSGVPPAGPLPDLPLAADDPKLNSERLQFSSKHSDPESPKELSAASPEILQSAHGYQPLESGQSSPKSSRRSRHMAASKGLLIEPAKHDSNTMSEALPTPSSVYSQVSSDSQQSALLKKPFSHHDLSSLRPERTKDVKKRIQGQRNRERRISEEDESKLEQGTPAVPLAPIPSRLAAQPSIDEINLFPAVPTSRPPSRTSTRRTQSRSRTHARQSSRASSSQRTILPLRHRQALEKSDIKILVDSGPNTDHFRAGAMSPEPSIAGSQNGSPTRSQRASRPGSLRDVTNIASVVGKKTSLRSLRSQISARNPKASNKPYRRGSGDRELDSEDEVSPLLGPSKNKPSRALSRRSYRNSVQDDDIRDALLTLGEAVRMQQEQMQSMFVQLNALSRSRRLTIDDDALAKRHRDSLQVKAKQARESLRPISDISSASATTNATYGSTAQASAASVEASLTDPFEYDEPVKRPGTAKSNKSATTGLHQPPPVAQVVPKGRLPEETSLASSLQEWEVDGADGKRLSVNHNFTTTDQMENLMIRGFATLA